MFSDIGSAPIILDGLGGYGVFEGRADQLYNWSTDAHTTVPINRALGYLDLEWEASSSVTFFAQAHLGGAQVRAQIAALPAQNFQGIDPVIGDATPVPIG